MTRLARTGRALVYVTAGCLVLVIAAAAAFRLWLPNLHEYKPEVERLLSEYLGQEILMTSVSAEWEGLTVVLQATGVRVAVEDHPGSGMRFGQIQLSINPIHLYRRGASFESLELRGPTIEAARLADGRFRVGDTILGTPRGTMQRLLQSRHLRVTEGTLVWRDALAPDGKQELVMDDVDILVRSDGGGRRFELSASAPVELMEDFAASGTYDPDSLESGTWTASVHVSARRLSLSGVPPAIQEHLPWQSRGHIDTDMKAEWHEGMLVSAAADITARDFVIPYAKDKKPLAARRFSSSLSWRHSNEEWRLVFEQPEIELDDISVSVDRFEVERDGDRRTYSARRANVQDLLDVAGRMDVALPWGKMITRLHPRGVFSKASLTLTGPFLDVRGWRFEGDFSDVGWRAQQRYPGIQGLDGHLSADDQRGELLLESRKIELDAPGTLRQAIAFEQARGRIEWYRWGRDWVVDVSDGSVANDDIDLAGLNFYARVPEDGMESAFVIARSRIRQADIARLRHYLPAGRMTAKSVAWLDRALVDGNITEGRFYLNGLLADFPYDHGGGELRVSAQVRGGLLDFHESWPNLEQLDGVVELQGSRFEARVENGVMMSSPIRNARIWSEDFFQRDRTLYIQGNMTAQADDVVHFLRRGPLIKNPPPEYSTMAANGEGNLGLMIELPFTRLKQESRVQGDYALRDAGVEVADGIRITGLEGVVRFTESTVESEGLEGELFGGPVRADVTTVEPGQPLTFAITGSGEADAARLSPVVGPVLVSRLQGRAAWNGRFVGGPGPNRLTVDSGLTGVQIRLPQPVGKSAAGSRRLDVDVAFDREHKRIDLKLEGGLGGELHYATQNGRPVLQRGILTLGASEAAPERDLAVAVRSPAVDVDAWLKQINDLRRFSEEMDRDRPEGDALFSHLRLLEIETDRLRYLDRDLGAVEIDAESGDGKSWNARIDGERLQGSGRLSLEPEPGRYRFEMTKLYWPQLENTRPSTIYTTPREPSQFVHLSIQAEDFRHGDKHLGRLDLEAGPEAHGWRIRQLSMRQPEMTIEARGEWSEDRFGAQQTRIDVSAQTADLGAALARLGLPGQVANGEAGLTAELNWVGEPGDFGLAALNGDLSFSARDGRFLKLEPGSGRLLGLINMDTLARRFKLDFTDVFSEGLAFDRINGEAEINTGRLRSDGIFIIGPAALMELSGGTDMGAETYDFEVTVAPQLGGNLSLAGAIANPAAGAMIFVVQKLFKKQMTKLIHYKYRVTGDWNDPQVDPVVNNTPGDRSQTGRN